MVFFHELGHFLVARWCGVAVKAFSIGFGPEIFGFNDRNGTRWRLSLDPARRLCEVHRRRRCGERQAGKTLERLTPEERKRSFQGKPVGPRAAVVAAGPIANFLLAIAIFTVIFSVFGEQITAAKVDIVNPGSAAERAGFQPGDRVLSIDGEPSRASARCSASWARVPISRSTSSSSAAARPSISWPRRNSRSSPTISATRCASGCWASSGAPRPTIGRSNGTIPSTPSCMAVKECYFIVSRSLGYLYGIVTGREAADQLGGPIRIAQVSGQVATAGFIALLNFAAIISVSIGLLNLFPIPMLDGGHLLFYGIEAIRGRPLSEYTQEIGFRIGLAFVLMLMIFATWNDLIHLMFL